MLGRDERGQIDRCDPDDVQDADVRQPTFRAKALDRGGCDAEVHGDLFHGEGLSTGPRPPAFSRFSRHTPDTKSFPIGVSGDANCKSPSEQ
jgi:hypothetical protein